MGYTDGQPERFAGYQENDKVPNARIRQLYGVTKCVDEKIDEGVLRWFGHVERMESDRITKRGYVGEWIDTVMDC